MRWHCFLVISLVGLSSAFSLSVRHPGQISIDPLSGPANKPPVFSSRALRSYDEPENGNTDIGDSVSEARVGSSLKSTLYDLAYKLVLKLDMDPTVVYNLLRVAKASGKLDNNKKVIRWLQYVNKYRTKRGQFRFDDDELFAFLTKTKSEAELVTLFQSLRRVPSMKNFADDMQAYIVAFRSRRQNAALLKASVKPDEAFRLLNLGIGTSLRDNPQFLQWLRYIKSYRELPGGVPFSDAQTVRFIIRERNYAGRTAYAATFESIKGVDDLKEFATKLQKELFAGWLRDNHTPELMERALENYAQFVQTMPKNDPIYRSFEGFTKFFAKQKGGPELLRKVAQFFDNNDHIAATAAASKV